MEAKKTLGVRRTKIINGWVIDPIRVGFKGNLLAFLMLMTVVTIEVKVKNAMIAKTIAN